VATVRITVRAFAHLERIFEFIAERDPKGALVSVQRIREAVMILERHPLIGRKVEDGRRELVISHGRNTYLALYRWIQASDTVLVLAIRNAREAGYQSE
jgi:plasmid stabilization system protein ParE